MHFLISFKMGQITMREALILSKDVTNYDSVGLMNTNMRSGLLSFNDPDFWVKYEKYYGEEVRNFIMVEQNSDGIDFGRKVIFRKNISKDLAILIFTINDINDIKLDYLLDRATHLNFSFAYISDMTKTKWQNEKIISNYQAFGKDYQNLPKIYDKILGPIIGETIDISKNPGHCIETYGIAMMAAPEMWFGPASWEHFDKQKVLSFANFKQTKVIAPNVVYVKLFDHSLNSYETEDIFHLQKIFRDHVGMDDIERYLLNLEK